MAKLIVRKNDEIQSEITLDPSKSWNAGRKPDAEIFLDDAKGISREHFKLFFGEGSWKLEVLSKLNNVTVNGETINVAILSSGFRFSLPPYEFEFSDENSAVGSTQAIIEPEVSLSDRTVVHQVTLAAYIKIMNDEGDVQQRIRLEGGDTWTAGRDQSAQILISDHRVSRRQFEVRMTNLGYEIVDLGSVNGTYINEKVLEPDDAVILKSGDVIRVLNHTLIFEVLDPHFFDKVENLPAIADPDPVYDQQYEQPLVQFDPNFQQAPPQPEVPYVDPAAERTKKFRMAIGAIAVIGLVLYLATNNGGGDSGLSSAVPIGSDPLSALTPQQKSEYKQSLELAKRYHMEGNYNLAVSETDEMTKKFNVKDPELERVRNTALAAIESQKQLIKQEKEEKERAAMEAKIAGVAKECGKKLESFNTNEELEACLVEALQLDPQHPLLNDLRTKMQALLTERELKRQQQADYSRRVRLLKSYFQEAKELEKGDDYIKTIAAYNKVIDSNLPDPDAVRKAAEKRLSQLKITMAKKIKQYEISAKEQNEKQQLKQAVLTLRAAVKIDPTRQDLKDRAEEIKNELRKQMMVFYQEGVLEESFGNVEGGDNRPGAKDKWKKIIEMDLADGEYYQKAYIKLKKYGAQ